MKFEIRDLLALMAFVALALATNAWLKQPGVMVRRQYPIYELWFEEDIRIWNDRQLRYWKIRK